jgi:hypothetical protein
MRDSGSDDGVENMLDNIVAVWALAGRMSVDLSCSAVEAVRRPRVG